MAKGVSAKERRRRDESGDSGRPQTPHVEQPTKSLEAELEREKNPFKRFFKLLGPGLITGASDDDPSGIGTYAQAGAATGFSALWTALFTFPMMRTRQFIDAKIGKVTRGAVSSRLR